MIAVALDGCLLLYGSAAFLARPVSAATVAPPAAPAGGGPDWAAVLSAVAASLSLLLVLWGLLIATRYIKLNAFVDASLFATPAHHGLIVRTSLESKGLTRITMLRRDNKDPRLRGDNRDPTVTVTEYRIDDSGNVFEVHRTVREAFRFVGTPTVEPARTMTDTLVFWVPEPDATTWGWRVDFRFDTQGLRQRWRPLRRQDPWKWGVTTFIPPILQEPTQGQQGRSPASGAPGTGGRPIGDEREVYKGVPDVQTPMGTWLPHFQRRAW
jgi:hypothetical protein